MSLKNFIKQNWPYLLSYVIILVLTGIVLLNNGKVQIHKHINAYVGNTAIDIFFKYITHLGDGLFAVIIALVLAFKNIRQSLYILLSYAGAGIVSYIMKHWVFLDSNRPHFVFQYHVRENLNEVNGVDLLAIHTFPSGHALSAFSLFFCLLFITKNNWLKLLYFIAALIAAFSRTYLSQHWLIDIYVGSIIGSCFSVLLYFIFYNKNTLSQINTSLPQLLSKNKTRV